MLRVRACCYTHHNLGVVWVFSGTHSSTAEVEHELMDLWNAVEKDKVVQVARRAAAARSRTRQDPNQPPIQKVPPFQQTIYSNVFL